METDPKKKNPLIPTEEEEPLSEAMRKEKEKSVIPVHGRHMLLRIILFVVALGIGIAGITFGFLGVFSSPPGLQEIAYNSTKLPLSKTLSLYYYVSGSGMAASQQANAVKTAYSTLYYESYTLFEEEVVYDDPYYSLGRLNASTGMEVALPQKLYDSLREASEQKKETYSLFLAPLERFWSFRLSSRVDDPLDSEAAKDYLDSYISLLKEDNLATLEFLGQRKVKLTEKEGYRKWKEENEYEGPLLSFGPLKQAYRMDYIREGMLEKGFKDGYLLSDGGSILSFGGLEGISTITPGYLNGKAREAIKVDLGDYSSFTYLRHFPLSGNDPTSYEIAKSGNTYLRNLDLDPTTGYPNLATSFYGKLSLESAVSSAYKALEESKSTDLASSAIDALYEPYPGNEVIYASSIKSHLTALLRENEDNFSYVER